LGLRRLVQIIIRDNEGADRLFPVPWDTRWPVGLESFGGDWQLADNDVEFNNVGGFAATDQLRTAIILCLFTNRRRPDWQPGDGSTEVGGWVGDSFDLDVSNGERPMGSLLWLLRRAPLTAETMRQAEAYCRDALQTLIDQRLVYNFDIATEMDQKQGAASITIRAFDVNGSTIFENAFPFI
jgi:phage gp46-like protein